MHHRFFPLPMKITISAILYPLSFLVLIACVTDADLELADESEPRLVLNSWFSPQHDWDLYLAESVGLNDSSQNWVSDARILLFENEILVDSFFELEEGKYRCDREVIEGNSYKVWVKAEGFPAIEAEDKVPEKVLIDSAYYVFATNEAYVLFQDPANQKNFYEIGPPFSQEPDPVILAEGYANYLAFGNFFADQLIDGQQYLFTAKQNLTFGGAEPDRYFEDCRRQDCYFNLKSLSEDLYKFYKTWIQHGFNINTPGVFEIPYISEPLNVHSNVEGGLGIFAAFNEDSLQISLR